MATGPFTPPPEPIRHVSTAPEHDDELEDEAPTGVRGPIRRAVTGPASPLRRAVTGPAAPVRRVVTGPMPAQRASLQDVQTGPTRPTGPGNRRAARATGPHRPVRAMPTGPYAPDDLLASTAPGAPVLENVHIGPVQSDPHGPVDPADADPTDPLGTTGLDERDLFGDLGLAKPSATPQAQAAAPDPLEAEAQRHLDRLVQAHDDLSAAENASSHAFEKALAAAQRVSEEEAEYIETLDAADPDHQLLRKRILDDFFRLERLVQKAKASAAAPTAAGAAAEAAAKKKGEKQARARRYERAEGLSRKGKLAIAFGVLIVARVAIFFLVELESGPPPAQLERTKESGRVMVRRGGPPGARAMKDGIPVLQRVMLGLDGADLRARAVGMDPERKPLTYSFTWIENGEIIAEDEEGVLPADKATPGATYQVRVIASNGERLSAQVTTDKLVYRPPAGAGEKKGRRRR